MKFIIFTIALLIAYSLYYLWEYKKLQKRDKIVFFILSGIAIVYGYARILGLGGLNLYKFVPFVEKLFP